MRAFRNSDPHARIMPKLLDWCDEASFVHWEQGSAELPDTAVARQAMFERGELGRVRHPSESHAEGEIPPETALQEGPRLEPASSEREGSGA